MCHISTQNSCQHFTHLALSVRVANECNFHSFATLTESGHWMSIFGSSYSLRDLRLVVIADMCSKIGVADALYDGAVAFGSCPLLPSSPALAEEQKCKTLTGRIHDDDEWQDRNNFDDWYRWYRMICLASSFSIIWFLLVRLSKPTGGGHHRRSILTKMHTLHTPQGDVMHTILFNLLFRFLKTSIWAVINNLDLAQLDISKKIYIYY